MSMSKAIVLCLLVLGSLVYLHGANAQVAALLGRGSETLFADSMPAEHSPLASDTGGLIKLNVVVSDDHGRPVGGLQSKDFTLMDNGLPSKIITFRQFGGLITEPAPKVKVIIVIDEVQLPASLISYERSSVETFLRQNGGHLLQSVSVFSLIQTGLWSIGASSTDGNVLADRVAHEREATLIRPNRGSKRGNIPASLGFTDPPIQEALEALGQIAATERRETGRKLLLWVGPGWGLGSGAYAEGKSSKEDIFYTIRWFSTLLREAGIALYSFSVGEKDGFSLSYKDSLEGVKSDHEASFMSLYRKVLAVQSGGRALGRENDLVSQMNSCVQDAAIFYSLSIDPSHAEHPDEYHKLEALVSKPGLTARTNTGYYDQQFYFDQPDPALRRVSVEQLQQMLGSIQRERDADAARQISGYELTERLNETQRLTLMAAIRGEKSRRAFTGLADASEFLDSRQEESSKTTQPDQATQHLMISKVSDYLDRTISKLPNFVASRTTVLYQSTSPFAEADTKIDYQPLHVASSSKETVLYRDGQEIAEPKSGKHRKAKDPDLTTYGTFGPALGFVHDAISLPGALTWSHWEQGIDGKYAVFDYKISAAKSLYEVYGCCLPEGDGTQKFGKQTAYRGEIVINPSDGAVIRLTAVAELNSFLPVDKSEILVEYGPVEIGGRSYFCPVRSVSMTRMRAVVTLREWDESFNTYGPYDTMLNDISYDDYHIFRGESHVLSGYQPAQDQKSSGSGPLPTSK